MPFSNPVAGSTGTLIRNQMQSQNFVTGVSGWAIFKNGNAEFNSGTFRGVVLVGNAAGAHIIIDPVTDAILMYNSSNQLIASVTPTNQTIGGVAVKSGVTVYDAVHPVNYVRMVGNQIQMIDNNTTPTAGFSLITPNNQAGNGGTAILSLLSGGIAGTRQAAIQLVSQSGDTTQGEYIQTTQGNISGTLVQADRINAFKHVHVGSYTANVNDGFGDVTVNHGASFTPTVGVLTYWDWNSSGAFVNVAWFQGPFTATQFFFFTRLNGGGNPGIGTTIGVHAILFG